MPRSLPLKGRALDKMVDGLPSRSDILVTGRTKVQRTQLMVMNLGRCLVASKFRFRSKILEPGGIFHSWNSHISSTVDPISNYTL